MKLVLPEGSLLGPKFPMFRNMCVICVKKIWAELSKMNRLKVTHSLSGLDERSSNKYQVLRSVFGKLFETVHDLVVKTEKGTVDLTVAPDFSSLPEEETSAFLVVNDSIYLVFPSHNFDFINFAKHLEYRLWNRFWKPWPFGWRIFSRRLVLAVYITSKITPGSCQMMKSR